MNKLTNTFLCAVLLLTAVACGKKAEKEENTIHTFYSTEESAPDGALRVNASTIVNSVQWKEANYRYTIERTPDESLGKVKDEQGDLYVDNRISLTIQKDEKPFYQGTFTKADFASLLDAGFMKNGLLEGMAFYKTTDEGLIFTASVSYPESDLFVPIILTIGANGTLSVAKDTSPEEYLGGE